MESDLGYWKMTQPRKVITLEDDTATEYHIALENNLFSISQALTAVGSEPFDQTTGSYKTMKLRFAGRKTKKVTPSIVPCYYPVGTLADPPQDHRHR